MHRLIILLLVLFMTANCFALQKNVASQKWAVFAFDDTDNSFKSGDAANITAAVRIDGGAVNPVDDANPTELALGYYVFDITAAESNGDYIIFTASSTTADIQVIGTPMATWTFPPAFNTLSISNARVNVDVTAISTDTTAADNLELDYDGTGLAKANSTIGTVTTYTGNTKQTADHTAGIADIPTVAEFEARSIVSADYVVVGDTIAGVTLVGTLTTYTGNTPQTADNDTLLTTIDGKVDTAQADLDIITGAAGVVLAANSITSSTLATSTLDARALAADFVAEIWAIAMSDLAAAAPSATASALTGINWIYEGWRNEIQSTSSTITLMKDDTTTPVLTWPQSEDGTTYIREEAR